MLLVHKRWGKLFLVGESETIVLLPTGAASAPGCPSHAGAGMLHTKSRPRVTQLRLIRLLHPSILIPDSRLNALTCKGSLLCLPSAVPVSHPQLCTEGWVLHRSGIPSGPSRTCPGARA